MSDGDLPKSLTPTPEAPWTDKLVDQFVSIIDTVDLKVLRPVRLVASVLVYGILILTAATLIAALFSISVIRLVDQFLTPGRVWIAYLGLGGIFTLAGLLVWSKRKLAKS